MTVFDDLLTHTCTIVTRTAGAQTGYGRHALTDSEVADVPCRFSRPRQSETIDDAGIRQRVDGKIFLNFAETVGLKSMIKDIKDVDGADVVTGEFEVIEIVPASSRYSGHHKEVLVRRA